MSQEYHDFDQEVRKALTNAPAVWTEQCPEPEILLDWIDRETAHPKAAVLLDHVISCAYCRGEFAALCEIRGRVPVTARPPRTANKITAWVAELMEQGFTLPVKALRASFQTMGYASAVRSVDLGRGVSVPTDLRPAWTAIRTLTPALRWAADRPASEYIVTVRRKRGRRPDDLVWEASAGSERRLAIPEQAGLEPGGIYLWRATARTAAEERSSPPVCFAVLTDTTRRQLEALEPQTQEGTPERIALCEAFGLYDEALQQVEMLIAQRPTDDALPAIRTRLLNQSAGLLP
jgi:hypothetical protein